MSDLESLSPAWRKLFEKANVPSQQRLAEDAGISSATVNRMVRSAGRTTPSSVQAVADVLSGGDTEPIWSAMNRAERDHGEFPVGLIADDLKLLTPRQRTALIALVRSMAYPRADEAGTEHGDSSAEKIDEEASEPRHTPTPRKPRTVDEQLRIDREKRLEKRRERERLKRERAGKGGSKGADKSPTDSDRSGFEDLDAG